MSRSEFVTTEMLHGVLCEKCRQCAEDSKTTAICTGSVGGTTRYIHVGLDGKETLEHSATVKRLP